MTLTNTGARRGSTVVQLYLGGRASSVPRAARELKAFRKVVLDPGESRVLAFDLPARAFAFYDGAAAAWRIEAGLFDLSVGFSAADIRQQAAIGLEAITLAARAP